MTSTAEPRVAGGLGFGHRLVQLHPSLRCNLACAHCYSSSGPSARTDLDPAVARTALADARRLGYTALSVSGGEPLLHPHLDQLLGTARDHGLSTAVVTNGSLVTPRRARALAALVDGVAVSLDGPAALHDEIRRSPRSYQAAIRAVGLLKKAGLAVAVIHTVTRRSLPALDELAATVIDAGADVLRLHPLELHGRGNELVGDALSAGDRNRVFLQVLALRYRHRRELAIALDLEPLALLKSNPSLVYADPAAVAAAGEAVVLDSVVIGADGVVAPVAYGMGHRYQVADLRHERLLDAHRRFVSDTLPSFSVLCRDTLHALGRADELLVSWHESLVRHSQEPAAHEVRGSALTETGP